MNHKAYLTGTVLDIAKGRCFLAPQTLEAWWHGEHGLHLRRGRRGISPRCAQKARRHITSVGWRSLTAGKMTGDERYRLRVRSSERGEGDQKHTVELLGFERDAGAH